MWWLITDLSKAKTWLIFADRFTGWVYLEKEATTKGLVMILRELFTTFGVSENLTFDDGPQFRAHDMKEFLAGWGIEHLLQFLARWLLHWCLLESLPHMLFLQ